MYTADQKIQILTGWALFAINYNQEAFDKECEPFVDKIVETPSGKYQITVKWTSSHKESTDTIEFHGRQLVSSSTPIYSNFHFLVDFYSLEEYASNFLDMLIDNVKYFED